MDSKKIFENIFSTKGLLVAVFLVIAYWMFSGDNAEEKKQVASKNTPIGVSDGYNKSAVEEYGDDLTQHLDPKLVPAKVAQAVKETAQAGAKEEEFLQIMVSKAANLIQEISSIDLDGDEQFDPIFVVPVDMKEGQEFVNLSVRVPDPGEVKSLPEQGKTEEWRDIVENKSVEVMRVSAIQSEAENLTVQASPNPQLYQHAPPYYSSGFGLSNMLLTGMMMHYMFSPRYFSPMYNGPHGNNPNTVNNARNNSANQSAKPSTQAATSKSGSSVGNHAFKKVSPQTMNQVKSTAFKSRASSPSGAGGFGKPSAAAPSPAIKKQPSASGFSPMKAPKRSFGGFGKRR